MYPRATGILPPILHDFVTIFGTSLTDQVPLFLIYFGTSPVTGVGHAFAKESVLRLGNTQETWEENSMDFT